MSQEKYLNLDEVTPQPVVRKVQLAGKTYLVGDMSVENFIETQRAARDVDPTDQLATTEALVAMIVRWIPDVDQVALRKLSMVKLRTLLDFINGRLDEQVAQAPGAAGEAPAGNV